MDDIAISVTNVSKTFKLPHEKQSSIKGALISRLKGGKSSFERQEVLRDITFEIKKGEFFGVVGRNGSGKSTLLKMLAGIYTPTQGAIQVNGKLTPFIELGVGFNPELTGRENVFLNGALLGFNRLEMSAMYDEIVSFAELEKFMDQKLKNYSSGMQVRLAFSIAIRAETEILVMDEVLAVGDAAFQKKCFDVFRRLKNEGRTIVLVTHDMSNVERFCDRVLVIHDGDILDLTSPQEAASIYAQINIKNIDDNANKKTKIIKNRWGTGGISVERVQYLSTKGEGSKIFEVGKPLSLKIILKRASTHKDTPVICGLAMFNADGVNVIGPNSSKSDLDIGSNEITMTVPNISIAPGEYKMTVAIFNEEMTEPYDFLDKTESFSVVSDHTVHGLVEVDSTWKSN